MLGVLLGWVARTVLAKINASAELLAEAQNEKVKHWSKIALDALLTLTLGFVIVAQASGGTAPDASTNWYNALALGVGLGLLANTALVSKFPK